MFKCVIFSFITSHPIMKISPRYSKPNQLEQCEIVAVLVNGDVIIVSSNERESFSFDQSIVQSGALCSSLHTCNAGIIATYSGTALLCKHTDDSHTFKLFPGYIGLCGKEVWIKSLSTLHNSQSEKNNVLYLAECQMDCYWKVIIANCIGDVLTEFSFQNLSLRVTAYCAVLLPTKEDNYSNVYLILATSDNNLHLLQCTINNSTQIVSTHWKLVGLIVIILCISCTIFVYFKF
uniref:Uncharacterized protein n=1 Tax=Trichobilharzia regenti TaxID=157069 RepID=A0AA85KKC1_TRIRE|nr:unnamed protein product [Trichobilharzia regenti]